MTKEATTHTIDWLARKNIIKYYGIHKNVGASLVTDLSEIADGVYTLL